MSEKAQALKAQKAILKGTRVEAKKIRTNVHFFRPKTLVHKKSPLYPRNPIKKGSWDDPCDLLRYPIKTDENTTQIEKNNTIVFIVDRRASKPEIRKAFETVFETRVAHVNTLITPLGLKKAFIKLAPDVQAIDVASKMGLA